MNILQTFLIWLRGLSVEKSKVEHIGSLYNSEVKMKMNEKNEELMQRAYLFYKNNVKGVSRYLSEVIFHCTAGKWANLDFIREMHIMPYNKIVKNSEGVEVQNYWLYRGKRYETLADIPEFVRTKRGRGFRNIGYQYLVLNGYTNYAAMKDEEPDLLSDGVIERGRPLNSIGAHCTGNNSHTVGVALTGLDVKKFTENQLESAAVIGLAFKMYQNRIIYSPHNKYSSKACPLYNVKKIAQRIKKVVREYQRSRKLVVDGIIGINTLAMLEKDYRSN